MVQSVAGVILTAGVIWERRPWEKKLLFLCLFFVLYIYIYTNQAVYKAFPRTKGLKFWYDSTPDLFMLGPNISSDSAWTAYSVRTVSQVCLKSLKSNAFSVKADELQSEVEWLVRHQAFSFCSMNWWSSKRHYSDYSKQLWKLDQTCCVHVLIAFSSGFAFQPILRHIFATGSAFCALKSSGTVVAWGDVLQGGRTPDRLLLGVERWPGVTKITETTRFWSWWKNLHSFMGINFGHDEWQMIWFGMICIDL